MSITSANSIYTIRVIPIFPTPVTLQGYATDDIITTDAIDSAQTLMGVDGKLSGGFVHVPVKQSIMLQADSLSNILFDEWWQAQQVQGDVYVASATILLPSIAKQYALTRGFLTSFPPIVDAGKTLKPRKYGITWESIIASVGQST